jgi:hemerythrin superfamily protein
MTESIIDILKWEHVQVDQLFTNVRENAEKRDVFFEDLKQLLKQHSQSEERVLYSQLEALKDLQPLAVEATEDHQEIDRIIQELDERSSDTPGWLELLGQLQYEVKTHVKFEEGQIFERLKQYFLEEELKIMGDEYHRVESRIRQVENVIGFMRTLRRTVQSKIDQFLG